MSRFARRRLHGADRLGVLSLKLGVPASFNEKLAARILEREPQLVKRLPYHPREPVPNVIPPLPRGLTALRAQYNVLAWREPEFQRLRSLILQGLKLYSTRFGRHGIPTYITCWANVVRKAEEIGWHLHASEREISGFYSITVGDGGKFGGATVFRAPGSSQTALEISPVARTLTLFRADLVHQVSLYRGKSERISIGFTAYDRKLEGVRMVSLA